MTTYHGYLTFVYHGHKLEELLSDVNEMSLCRAIFGLFFTYVGNYHGTRGTCKFCLVIPTDTQYGCVWRDEATCRRLQVRHRLLGKGTVVRELQLGDN